MSNPTKTAGKREDWIQPGEKPKESGHSLGEMASQAGAIATQAVGDVSRMASQAVCDVGKKADDLTASAGAGMKQVGERISRSVPQEGMLGSASQAVARTVREGGEYLEEAKFSGLAKDLAQVVRQNPIPSVCVALGLGWLLARRLRN